MKKSYLILILVIGLLIYGFVKDDRSEIEKAICDKMENSSIYPIYNSLDDKEKEKYIGLCIVIEEFRDSEIVLGEFDSAKEMMDFQNKFKMEFEKFLYEHPEYFWVSPYNYQLTQRAFEGKFRLFLTMTYLLDEESVEVKREIFNDKVEEIVSEANRQNGTYNKVLFVHDYILKNTKYDHVLAESDDNTGDRGLKRSAYGCLVEGETICSGYTLAFNLIMQKLGYECGAVFNADRSGIINIFDPHVWTYCKLDGEYYYFDLTWDDVDPASEEYLYYPYNYCYFAVNKEELSHSLEHQVYMERDDGVPECNGTKYNYFIYNNMSFEQYDYETVKASILKQSINRYVILRFENLRDLMAAENELLKEGKIFQILPHLEKVKHNVSNTNKHLIIYL